MSKKNCEVVRCPNNVEKRMEQMDLCLYHHSLLRDVMERQPSRFDLDDWSRCDWCMSMVPRTVSHHTDYENDVTMLVCDSCHQRIHGNSDHVLFPRDPWNADKPLRRCDAKWLVDTDAIFVYTGNSIDYGGGIAAVELSGNDLLLDYVKTDERVWTPIALINRCDVSLTKDLQPPKEYSQGRGG